MTLTGLLTLLGMAVSAGAVPLFIRELVLRERQRRRRVRLEASRLAVAEAEAAERVTAPMSPVLVAEPSGARLRYSHGLLPRDPHHRPAAV